MLLHLSVARGSLCMRVLTISGAVLVLVGLWIIIRPPSYSREESVLKIGNIEAKMQQRHAVPGWVGGIALGAGLVLVVIGWKKRM
jgi:type II secretory pathway component PulM